MPRVIQPAELRARTTVALARWLLGKTLVRADSTAPGGAHRARITETEAYHGPRDLACHASKGRTPRTEVMFAPGGVWYVYLCYGMHEMLNLVTGPADWPAAVLIRGVENISGPGRLTRAFGIGRALNARPAAPASGLWLEDDGLVVPRRAILSGPRIGVAYAGPVWAAKPWRFCHRPALEGDPSPPLTRRAIKKTTSGA
jgi:DNA-3-methyladenine glycosylase